MTRRFPYLLFFLSSFIFSGHASPWLAGSALSSASVMQDVPVQLVHSLPAPCFIFADGFGNEGTTERIADQVVTYLTRQLVLAGVHIPGMGAEKEAERLLQDAFLKTANHLQSQAKFTRSGVACVSVLCSNAALYTANIGNARAVLSRGGSAYALSTDHSPEHPAEYDRLIVAGRSPYDIASLPMTRSIGNTVEGPLVAAVPSISVTPLTYHDEFIIIGNHDFWQCIEHQDAVDVVHKGFNQSLLPEAVALGLVEYATSKTSKNGNPSVIVLKRERMRAAMMATPRDTMAAQLGALFELPATQWLSYTVTLSPLISALLKAYEYMKAPVVEAQPQSEVQHSFVDLFMPYGARTDLIRKHFSLNAFGKDELRSWASEHVDEINNQIKADGFELELRPVPPPSFYVASVLNVKVQWRTKGVKTKLRKRNAVYDAVLMDKNFLTYTAPGHNHPIFVLLTRNKDLVFMTKAPKALSNFGLLSVAQSLQEAARPQEQGFDELIFPMVKAIESGSIEWIKGMYLVGKECRIVEALQETHFKMNEEGAHAKSAVAMSLKIRSAMFKPVRTYAIDEPFYCWISRPGMKYPLFAGYLDTAQWENPGTMFEDSVPVEDEVPIVAA